MKDKILIGVYFLILIFILPSCENEDSSHIKDIEGHWLNVETRINIEVNDPKQKALIEEFVNKSLTKEQISYEFKNDRTYYYRCNNTDPVKGKVKTIDKNYYQLEDIRGDMKVIRENDEIYVISDIKKDIIKELNISSSNLIKVEIIEVFEKGLSTNSIEKK